jgi:hypothetical protein
MGYHLMRERPEPGTRLAGVGSKPVDGHGAGVAVEGEHRVPEAHVFPRQVSLAQRGLQCQILPLPI